MYTEKNNADVSTEITNKECKETIRIKEFVRAGAIALLTAIIVKSFFFEAYKIPTGSMENTLLAGDFIIVSKAAYSFSTPKTTPFLNIEIPQAVLFSTGQPAYNDVIVFTFPGYSQELTPSTDASYIKRIAGLPGDTIRIINKELYVNGEKHSLPSAGKASKTSVYGNDIIEKRIFPSGKHWNRDNYGPVIVPKKGMTISLDPKNVLDWKTIIDREYGKRVVSDEGTVITIEGKPVRSYTFVKNYYFVMGDNRDDSMDSRYWGFVPEDAINGKAMIVYWSHDQFNNNGFFSSIRFDRIFNIIK